MNLRTSFAISLLALATSIVTLFTTYKYCEEAKKNHNPTQLMSQSLRRYEVVPDVNALAISLSLLQKPQP